MSVLLIAAQVKPRLLGLPSVVEPPGNQSNAAQIALGRKLFFDKRLSVDNSISCATCHDPSYGFADPHSVSVGVKARHGERNSPTLLNVAFMPSLMWDGRAASLEEQAKLAFETPAEFDLPIDDAVSKLKRQGYSDLFQSAFGQDVTPVTITKALASYERTLLAGDSPFDRFIFQKDESAISREAERGFRVFLAAKCDSCHLIMTEGLHPFALKYIVFTDGKFHNLGVDAEKPNPDPGLYAITGSVEDWGRFRTPTLRNVGLTAPYFHDGSAATLKDVVEFYNKGGVKNRNLDPALKPLNLSEAQKQDLVSFLESLTSTGLRDLEREAGAADNE